MQILTCVCELKILWFSLGNLFSLKHNGHPMLWFTTVGLWRGYCFAHAEFELPLQLLCKKSVVGLVDVKTVTDIMR